jgi:hypothetical protein
VSALLGVLTAACHSQCNLLTSYLHVQGKLLLDQPLVILDTFSTTPNALRVIPSCLQTPCIFSALLWQKVPMNSHKKHSHELNIPLGKYSPELDPHLLKEKDLFSIMPRLDQLRTTIKTPPMVRFPVIIQHFFCAHSLPI